MKELTQALLKIQMELPTIDKDGINPHFKSKFATLSNIMNKVLPVVNKHGVFVSQAPDTLDGQPVLVTTLVHAASGEQVASTMPLFLVKNDPQAQGSAITYARRYALVSMLGLVVDDDDDGSKASAKPADQPKPAYIDPLADVKKEVGAIMDELGFKGQERLNMAEVFIGKKIPSTKVEYENLLKAAKQYKQDMIDKTENDPIAQAVDDGEDPNFDE